MQVWKVKTAVVGAGLAGLNAARFLTEDALILEASASFTTRVQCAEAISIGGLRRAAIDLEENTVTSMVHWIRMNMPNGTYVGKRHELPIALIINKPALRIRLAQEIRWPIVFNSRVHSITSTEDGWCLVCGNGNHVYCDQLIAADGGKSSIRQLVGLPGLRMRYGRNVLARFNECLDTDILDLFFGQKLSPGGYAWLFPRNRYEANVGLVGDSLKSTALYFSRFRDFLYQRGFGSFDVMENRSGWIPTDFPIDSVALQNFCLVGDAGGFTDPMFGSGNAAALVTGQLAADAANNGNCSTFYLEIARWPFNFDELYNAAYKMNCINDALLNWIGSAYNGMAVSDLESSDNQCLRNIMSLWKKARPYLW